MARHADAILILYTPRMPTFMTLPRGAPPQPAPP